MEIYDAILIEKGNSQIERLQLLNRFALRQLEVIQEINITLESRIVEVDYINQYTISHNRYEKWRDGVLIQTELERFPMVWTGRI